MTASISRRSRFSGLLPLLVVLGGCTSRPASAPAAPAGSPAAVVAPASAPATTPASAPAAAAAHDPAHPPIDCPLHGSGVDPRGLRPFADVEKYIAHLERPDRAKWQKPDEVVKALGLKGAETVADLGAGSGYFSFRFARALPRGKVYALDIEPEMIRHVHHKAMTEGIANVHAKLTKPDDPGVPPGTDLVFICDVLHHVQDQAAWLAKLRQELKPGARVVLIEFKPGKLPVGPPEHAKLPRAEILKLTGGAGLKLEAERTDLLPYQTLYDLRRP